jgi:UDP-2-acetamido-2,6-beta-L-arabino-hexul-4-ose reductase
VYKFVIPPKVSHAIKNIGEKDNILIAFNTVPHDPENPDTITEILMD